MIDLVTQALVGYLSRETADLGEWVHVAALDADAGTPMPEDLTVALYDIEESDLSRNRPLEESPLGDGLLVRPPMLVRLSYVMAYFGTHDEAQRRLARVIETFHTTPTLAASELDPRLAARVASLDVHLFSPSLDARNQLWTGFGRAMRLALYYHVDVAPIPALPVDGHGRVSALDVRFQVA